MTDGTVRVEAHHVEWSHGHHSVRTQCYRISGPVVARTDECVHIIGDFPIPGIYSYRCQQHQDR